MAQQSTETDWVSRFADEVIAEAERRAPGKPIVCASGLSPSGPIHLGNLREVMTPHLVADEIRRRGYACEHILSWDDYDRYRKVPAGVDPSWAEHIGKPLTSVPAPPGSPYGSWAEHFKAAMEAALQELGVEYRGISQTEQYTSGAYREQVLHAMKHRAEIDGVLDRYRTKDKATGAPKKQGQKQQKPVDEAELEAAEGSGAASEDDGSAGSAGYFPYKPYCTVCEKDLTTVTSYDDESTELAYHCTACGHAETVVLREFDHGKLVWKVDWPMRWAYEGVVFEPSGVDHSSPGSSFVVGGQIVREIFGADQPIGPMYAFVGISGMAKMSSSKGGVPTPGDALKIMEAPLLRWLYARRRPNQSFKIAFDQEIQRLYDEWDALERKIADGTVQPADAAAYARAIGTAAGELPTDAPPAALPHPGLGHGHHRGPRRADAAHPRRTRPGEPGDLAGRRPGRGSTRPSTGSPPRSRPSSAPSCGTSRTRSCSAPSTTRRAPRLRLLLDGLDEHWSLDGLTALVYGVPKIRAGLAPDAKPTPELKVAQRAVLRAALQAAGQPGDRTAAAHAAAGGRRGPGAQAARRLTRGRRRRT